jgi:hypothetical protein
VTALSLPQFGIWTRTGIGAAGGYKAARTKPCVCLPAQSQFEEMDDQQSSFGADKVLSFVAHCPAAFSSRMVLKNDTNAARQGDGAKQ